MLVDTVSAIVTLQTAIHRSFAVVKSVVRIRNVDLYGQ